MPNFAKPFYNSRSWRQCRASYIDKVHGLCERCDKAGLILHHKIELTPMNIHDPNITLNHDNLQYLCHDCHNRVTFGTSEMLADGLMFDDAGDVVER
jgi:5-methylcytosine-specific restriction protein A